MSKDDLPLARLGRPLGVQHRIACTDGHAVAQDDDSGPVRPSRLGPWCSLSLRRNEQQRNVKPLDHICQPSDCRGRVPGDQYRAECRTVSRKQSIQRSAGSAGSEARVYQNLPAAWERHQCRGQTGKPDDVQPGGMTGGSGLNQGCYKRHGQEQRRYEC
jgi:hypothetical protein